MQQYPKSCDEERTMKWIEWNIQNYKECGFGLWSVVLIETNKLIGDCGITIQNIDGKLLPETGIGMGQGGRLRIFQKTKLNKRKFSQRVWIKLILLDQQRI